MIFDKDPTGTLVRLDALLALIRTAIPQAGALRWIVKGAWGYGERVCELEDRLRTAHEIEIAWEDICGIVEDSSEGFYNVVFASDDGGSSFGVSDSTYLFVEGGPDSLHRAVADTFLEVNR